MIIQLLADAGILSGGKKKIVVSVDPTKPLAQAIPNILSKLKLTKKESFTLYFTTASTSLENGLGHGEVDPTSEATSSTGGLTISSDGLSTLACRLQGNPPAARRQMKEIQVLGVPVDWNSTPVQLGLKNTGCYMWIKRTTRDQEADAEPDGCDLEEAGKVLECLRKHNPKNPFEFLSAATTADNTPCAFFAKKDIPPGQVIWREAFTVVEAYPTQLVSAITGSEMLSLHLPWDKEFTGTAAKGCGYSDEEWAKALSQATLNGIAVGEDDMGFAPWMSVFTRCCWPNAMSFLSPDRKTVDVVAIDTIPQGDEVTLPWDCIIDSFWLPPDRRTEYVERRYHRRCACGRCLSPAPEDLVLTGAFYSATSPSSSSSSSLNHKLAVQVMREEYESAIQSADRQRMLGFLVKYTEGGISRSPDETDDLYPALSAKPSLQLHPHHWRLSSMRTRLLSWYRCSPRRGDKRLPCILLDQLEMETRVMPRYWPPKLLHYRQWKVFTQQQSQHVSALLRRMAADRGRFIDWTALAQLDLLESHWKETRAVEILPIPAQPPQEDPETDDE